MPGHPLFPPYLELFPSGSEFALLPSPGTSLGATFAILLQCSPTSKPSSLGFHVKKPSSVLLQWWGINCPLFSRTFMSLWRLAPAPWSHCTSFHSPPRSVCPTMLVFSASWDVPSSFAPRSHRASCSLCLGGHPCLPFTSFSFLNPRPRECSQ